MLRDIRKFIKKLRRKKNKKIPNTQIPNTQQNRICKKLGCTEISVIGGFCNNHLQEWIETQEIANS